MTFTLHLGEIWHTPRKPSPFSRGEEALVAIEEGGLAVDAAGKIAAVGEARALKAQFPGARLVDHGGRLIVPGFVDAHVHFPQLDLIGCYGERLLTWLVNYTYPREASFAARDVAEPAAARFVTELLANGTTCAMVYASSHLASAEALCAEVDRRGTRAIVGKVSMDTDAPANLLSSVDEDLAANETLITRWHGRHGRVFVALTPRFALSCSDAMLRGLGELRRRHPSVYVQTHHAETDEEIAAVRARFPRDVSYAGVYERTGLLGPRTVLGHVIHATDDELALLAKTGTKAAHCPTSNLFLGSGLFPLRRLEDAGVGVALATDVGGGTSFSLWRTMATAYEVQAMRRETVSPAHLFWLATQGGAEALSLGDVTGSFAPGKAADFQVLAWSRSRLLAERFAAGATPFERLFALIMLGDDRLTASVHVDGREVYTA